MKDQLITFELAKLAKKNKFIGYKSTMHYRISEEALINGLIEDHTDHNLTVDYLSAPPQSVLQKWLREIHNIIVSPFYVSTILGDLENKYGCTISKKGSVYDFDIEYQNTWEEVLEEGLFTGLNLLK